MSNSGEPTKAETVASEACTRAGAFALLLSVTLFLLIPYWVDRKNDVALSRYVADRLNLTLFVDMLADDPLWQKYKASHETAESTSIDQLLKVSVVRSGSEIDVVKPPANPHAPTKRKIQHGNTPPGIPDPPTNLTASFMVELSEMPPIADVLRKLNDPELLTHSREVSNFFDFSIVRWTQKRNILLFRNVFTNDCTTKELEIPHKGPQSVYFVPAIDGDALLSCLTLSDVRELAQFELPVLSNPTQIGGRIAREIDVNPGSLPRDPYWASLLAQTLLFFVIVYFAAFAREAVASASFPAHGTLFGAFSGSRWTLGVLFVGLWSPLIASLGVATASREWSLAICSVLICCGILSVHLILQRKSYFGSINPRLLINGMQPTNKPTSSSSPAGTQIPD